MPLLETGYRRWKGQARGIWYRRGVIARVGLKACLSNSWMKRIVGMAWMSALAMVMLLFFIGQLIVPDSILQDIVESLGDGTFGKPVVAVQAWLAEHPQLAVHFTYNVFFCIYTYLTATLSFVALAIAIPQMVTLDLASRAMLVYSSKAITRFDYFLGKVGIVFGILFLTWLGPTLAGWFLGNVLAPKWSYFVYSFPSLLNALQFIGLSSLFLAVLTLGVSAFSSKDKATTAAWIMLWLIGNAFVPIGRVTKGWLQHFSFSHNLDQIALWSFQVRADLADVYATVPYLEFFFGQISRRNVPFFLREYDVVGALIGLGVMLVIAMFIVHKRVKAE